MPSVSRGVGPSRCIKEDCSLLRSSSTINSIRTIFTHCALCNAQCAFVSTYICTCKSICKVKGTILYDQAHEQSTPFPPFSHTVHPHSSLFFLYLQVNIMWNRSHFITKIKNNIRAIFAYCALLFVSLGCYFETRNSGTVCMWTDQLAHY